MQNKIASYGHKAEAFKHGEDKESIPKRLINVLVLLALPLNKQSYMFKELNIWIQGVITQACKFS